MAFILTELTERNLAKHDERLAEIREKRMIDPNSEKFYRIWSWIREVNENLANGGNLTTPQQSRPTTARRRSEHQKSHTNNKLQSVRKSARLEEDSGDDSVEDLMNADDNSSPAAKIPPALINVTTFSAVRQVNPIQDLEFIDEDVKAVDDEDYEPVPPVNSRPAFGNLTRQNVWANLASTKSPRKSYQQQRLASTPTTPVQHVKLPSNTPNNAYQNLAQTPRRQPVAKQPGVVATDAVKQKPPTKPKLDISNNGDNYFNKISRRTSGFQSKVSAGPSPVVNGYENNSLPSAIKNRRVAQTPQPRLQTLATNTNVQNRKEPLDVFYRLHITGEKLKPRPFHMSESRSQASLVSSDPSAASKISLPLMNKIKHITSKVKPTLKTAFRGSNNVVMPSNSSIGLSKGSNIGLSTDSLAEERQNNPYEARTPSRSVRFVGVPSLSDDDRDDIRPPPKFPPKRFLTRRNQIGQSIVATQPSPKFVQQQRVTYHRPILNTKNNHQSRNAPAPLQVTLV